MISLPTIKSPHIAFGKVWHTRLRPRRHHFLLPTYFLLLPMRTLRAAPNAAGVLALNSRGELAFHDADHGDGRSVEQGGAAAWVDELLHGAGIHDALGELWLQCYPRVLGYTFKPVSFWYCHTESGELRAILAEVNNTFGERHVYLLRDPQGEQPLRADKVFHVSPFCPVSGHYEFKFQQRETAGLQALQVSVSLDDGEGPLLRTGMNGHLQLLTATARRRALWQYPLLTMLVMTRIHWHAMLLWLKGAPFFAKPARPAAPLSYSSLTSTSPTP